MLCYAMLRAEGFERLHDTVAGFLPCFVSPVPSVLKPNDPVLVDLKELATRSPESAAQRFHVALKEAGPGTPDS